MDFRLLGPLEVRVDDRPIPLGGGRQRALLAVLLLEANRVVPVGQLVDRIWGQAPPSTVTSQLQAQVSGLRRVLSDAGVGGDLVVTRSPGYLIRVRPGQLDLQLADERAARGRAALADGRLEEAASAFAAALDLWHGPALADVNGAFVEAAAHSLAERRLVLLEERIDAEMRLGRHAELIPELTALAAEHPLRERLRAVLMTALYRCGRQAEALAVYRRTRELLLHELGVDPGPELQHLERAVLNADPALDVAPRPRVNPVASPAQLPADIADFTGRAKQVAQIRDLLAPDPHGADEVRAVRVVALAGRAGVGKTALAVHVAHQLRDAHPDGQLYVNLQGAGREPMHAAEALGGFLRALGVDGTQIPDGAEQRASMYRSRLAGRRLFVLLDNAAGEAQVRPLLPGTPGCPVLVTGRSRLDALAGVPVVELDTLGRDSAVELLSRVAGRERAAAEPEAAEEVVRLCGHLPLAVRIAAARLAARPHWPLSRMVTLLADERGRLDQLRLGDLEVRASLSLSYEGLDSNARCGFRRLGLLDATDFASWTAAALLDTSGRRADAVLDTLVEAGLLEVTEHRETGADRYRFHELIGPYARERLHAAEPATARAAALARLLDAGLSIVQRINRARFGTTSWIDTGASSREELAPELSRQLRAAPTAWFEAEQHNLVEAVRQGAAANAGDVVWQLEDALAFFFLHRGGEVHLPSQVDYWRRSHECALEATRRAGSRRGEAVLLFGLGVLNAFRNRAGDARDCLYRAGSLFEGLGDPHGTAFVRCALGLVHALMSQAGRALPYFHEGLRMFRDCGDSLGRAMAEDSIGRTYLRQGRLAEAEGHLRAAVESFRRLGHHSGEATALDSLGSLQHRERRFDEAIGCFRRCAGIGDELDEGIVRTRALLGLADVDLDCGRLRQARSGFEQCRDTARGLGYRHGEAYALDGLGRLDQAAGESRHAVREFQRALEVSRELPIPLLRAATLRRLGTAQLAAGDRRAAERSWRASLELFQRHGGAEAGEVAGLLAGMAGSIADP